MKNTNIPFFIFVTNKGAGTLGIMTFTIMTLSIMIFRIMTFNIMGLVTTLSINDTQHRHSAYSVLSAIMQSFIMLSVAVT